MSRHYEANKAFYGAVFGYQFGDIGAEGMQYATLDLDGRPVGGIGEIGADQPAETPASWGTYFARRRHRRRVARGDRAWRQRRRAGVGQPVRPDGSRAATTRARCSPSCRVASGRQVRA